MIPSLELPIIKSRILTFLNEVEYDKEFTKTMVTSYVSLLYILISIEKSNKE